MKRFLLGVTLGLLVANGGLAQSRDFAVGDAWNVNGHRFGELVITAEVIRGAADRPAAVELSLHGATGDEALCSLVFKKGLSFFQLSGDEVMWNYVLAAAGTDRNRVLIKKDYVSHMVVFYQTEGDMEVSCSLSMEDVDELRMFVTDAVKTVGIKKRKE